MSISEYLLWLVLPECRRRVALDEDGSRAKILAWCCTAQPALFAELARRPEIARDLADLDEPGPDFANERFAPSRLMHEVHRLRPDLQAEFDLSGIEGRARYYWWWLAEAGATRTLDLAVPAGHRARLNVFDPSREGPFPVCDLLALIWHNREDLRGAFDLTGPAGRCAMLYWFLAYGIDEAGARPLIDARAWAWLFESGGWTGVPAFAEAVWTTRADLQQAFPRTPAGGTAFLAWFEEHAPAEMSGFLASLDWLRNRLRTPPDAEPAAVPAAGAGRPGVTVFARRDAEPGQEPAEAVARALGEYDVPVTVVHTDAPDDAGAWDATTVNLFCLGPLDLARLLLRHGPERFAGGYNIAFWGSDVPEWPAAAQPLFALLDEVWTPSRFACDALAPIADVPVVRMPIMVDAAPQGGTTRAALGLPENGFVFLCAADFAGAVSPQSPFVVIEAFRTAFARGDVAATLAVWVEHPEHSRDTWLRLLETVNGDPDIVVLNAGERGATLADAVSVCDAFVSLHRGEPTGRRIALAMRLGKPVIVTDYSASRDFTGPDNACLVGYRTVPVDSDYTGLGGGQVWADPDTGAAAAHMRRLAGDPDLARRLATAGQALAAASFDPATAGRRYAHRLRVLGLI